MSASYSHNSSSHTSRECDDFLDFLDTLGADVEFWAGVEGAGPCVVNMGLGCAERDVGVGAIELYLEAWRHGERRNRWLRHAGGVTGVSMKKVGKMSGSK